MATAGAKAGTNGLRGMTQACYQGVVDPPVLEPKMRHPARLALVLLAGVAISSCVENAEDPTGIRGRGGQFVGSQRQE